MAMANMNLIGVFVTKLWPVQALACGGGGDGGDGSATKTIISPKFSNFGDIIILFSYLSRTQVNENFRAVRPHHRADKFITREKNNHQFFIYGSQCEKIRILGYSGRPGWPINNRTGPILLPRHPLTYINLHIKYGSNPIRIF